MDDDTDMTILGQIAKVMEKWRSISETGQRVSDITRIYLCSRKITCHEVFVAVIINSVISLHLYGFTYRVVEAQNLNCSQRTVRFTSRLGDNACRLTVILDNILTTNSRSLFS